MTDHIGLILGIPTLPGAQDDAPPDEDEGNPLLLLNNEPLLLLDNSELWLV